MVTSLSVEDLMTPAPVTFLPQMDLTDAISELVRREISGAPVVDERGNLKGILTERDCLDAFLKASYYSELGGPVSEFMSRDVKTIEAHTSLIQIAELFVNSKYRRYPVLEGDRLVGLISRRDVLRALLEIA